MNRQFDLIIFDWDGTLVDSIDWIVHRLKVAAEAVGYDDPGEQAAKDIIGLSLQRAMAVLFPEMDEETRRQFVVSYSKAFFSKPISKEDLFLGVAEMLQTLKSAGYLLAVATGKTDSGLQKALKGTGLLDFFNVTRCADQAASKPSPLMLNQIIEEVGVRKERAVMIGDSIYDMEMASNASISSIAVSCGAHSAKQLLSYQPILNLQQTVEILKIL